MTVISLVATEVFVLFKDKEEDQFMFITFENNQAECQASGVTK
jgi:hypothetical protein